MALNFKAIRLVIWRLQMVVVFSTTMTGYPESLTDPSYEGQILCSTYPLIGNYGVPRRYLPEESNNISSRKDSCPWPDHIRLFIEIQSLDAVKALTSGSAKQDTCHLRVDTRELTKVIRDNGSMLGRIIPEGASPHWDVEDPNTTSLVARVSCKEVIHPGPIRSKELC